MSCTYRLHRYRRCVTGDDQNRDPAPQRSHGAMTISAPLIKRVPNPSSCIQPMVPSVIWSVLQSGLTSPNPTIRNRAAEGMVRLISHSPMIGGIPPLTSDTLRSLWTWVIATLLPDMRKDISIVQQLLACAGHEDRHWMWQMVLSTESWMILRRILPYIPPTIIPESAEYIQQWLHPDRPRAEQNDALAIIDFWLTNTPSLRDQAISWISSYYMHPRRPIVDHDVWIRGMGILARHCPHWLVTTCNPSALLRSVWQDGDPNDPILLTVLEEIIHPMLTHPPISAAVIRSVWSTLDTVITTATEPDIVIAAAATALTAIQYVDDPSLVEPILMTCWRVITDPTADHHYLRLPMAKEMNRMLRWNSMTPILLIRLLAQLDQPPSSRAASSAAFDVVLLQALLTPPWNETIVESLLDLADAWVRRENPAYRRAASVILSYAWGHRSDERVYRHFRELMESSDPADPDWLPLLLPGIFSPTVGARICTILFSRVPTRASRMILQTLQNREQTIHSHHPYPHDPIPSDILPFVARACLDHPTETPASVIDDLWHVAPQDALSVIDRLFDAHYHATAIRFLATGWGHQRDDAIVDRMLTVIPSITDENEGSIGMALIDTVVHGIDRGHPTNLAVIGATLTSAISPPYRSLLLSRIAQRWQDAPTVVATMLDAIHPHITDTDYAAMIDAWGHGWGTGWEDTILQRITDLAATLTNDHIDVSSRIVLADSLASAIRTGGSRGWSTETIPLMESLIEWYASVAHRLSERDRDRIGTACLDMIIDGVAEPARRESFAQRLLAIARSINPDAEPDAELKRIVEWIGHTWLTRS